MPIEVVVGGETNHELTRESNRRHQNPRSHGATSTHG
jgi:hypothetical protein